MSDKARAPQRSQSLGRSVRFYKSLSLNEGAGRSAPEEPEHDIRNREAEHKVRNNGFISIREEDEHPIWGE